MMVLRWIISNDHEATKSPSLFTMCFMPFYVKHVMKWLTEVSKIRILKSNIFGEIKLQYGTVTSFIWTLYFPDPISWSIQNSSTNLHVKLMNTSHNNSFKSKIWCLKEAPSFSKYYECRRGRSTTQLFDNRKRMEWDYYAETSAFEATEARDARFFAKLSLRCSRCSLRRNASSFWYSAASFLALTILFFLIAILRRFLCRVTGVTSRWILGALLLFFPAITENPTHAV